MKTSELTGPALDWAVAKCEGLMRDPHGGWVRPATEDLSSWRYGLWAPSSDWSQGGPIIEREGISVTSSTEGRYEGFTWQATQDDPEDEDAAWSYGPTPLIAAMRCYCCAKLGDEIEIPEELLQCQQPNL